MGDIQGNNSHKNCGIDYLFLFNEVRNAIQQRNVPHLIYLLNTTKMQVNDYYRGDSILLMLFRTRDKTFIENITSNINVTFGQGKYITRTIIQSIEEEMYDLVEFILKIIQPSSFYFGGFFIYIRMIQKQWIEGFVLFTKYNDIRVDFFIRHIEFHAHILDAAGVIVHDDFFPQWEIFKKTIIEMFVCSLHAVF